MQCHLVKSYRCLESQWCLHHEDHEIQEKCLNLKVKVFSSFKISVTVYVSTWPNITEHLNFQQYRYGALKFLIAQILLNSYKNISYQDPNFNRLGIIIDPPSVQILWCSLPHVLRSAACLAEGKRRYRTNRFVFPSIQPTAESRSRNSVSRHLQHAKSIRQKSD